MELFEECSSKNYFSCFRKVMSIDFTHAQSQLTRGLSKLLGCSAIDMSKNESDPARIISQVLFQGYLNEFFKCTEKRKIIKGRNPKTLR